MGLKTRHGLQRHGCTQLMPGQVRPQMDRLKVQDLCIEVQLFGSDLVVFM